MSVLSSLLQQHKERILSIAARYQAQNLRVFGSVARGEDTADSDIDLLVDFLPGATLLDQVGLIDALSEELGRKVDVVSAPALSHLIRQQILQDAISI